MITDIGIYLAYLAVNIYSIIPNYRVPDEYLTEIDTIAGYMLRFDGIIPIIYIWKVISTILFLELMYWAIRFTLRIFNYLRGSGSLEI